MWSSFLAQGLFTAVLGLSCLIPFGILILSWPGIQPVSPALEDRFSTTEPPGKSQVGKELWRKTNTFWVDWWLSQRHNLFINWFNNYFLSTHLILHFGENIEFSLNFSSVQSLSCVRLFVAPWTAACQASLSITNSQSLTQSHVHWVGDAIQPSHPLSSPSPSALNHSQHQGLFKWVSSSHQVAKVLEFQLQHQSFKRTLRTDLL